MGVRQIAERAWSELGGTRFLVAVLTVLGLLLLLSLVLPQAPVLPADAAAFSRWLAEVRLTLGVWTDPLHALGLLTLRASVWMRGALALLALALVARAGALVESWPAIGRLERARRSLVCMGALLLILGWGMHLLWGWTEVGVTGWPEEEIFLPDRDLALALDHQRFARLGYGLYLVRSGGSVGLEVRAWDDDGDALSLLISSGAVPQEQVRFSLSEQSPDAYFGIPSVDLIFRARMQQRAPAPGIQVQVYRSASGELLTETLLNGSGALYTEDLRLTIDTTLLPDFRVIYNPGAPVTVIGWLLLVVAGLAGMRFRGRGSTAPVRNAGADQPDAEEVA